MGLSNRDDIERGIKKLFRPGDVVEIRMPKAGTNKTISGYFNDYTKLADAVAHWSGNVPTIYWTLNPVNPDLLARANNRVVTKAEFATADKDILCRRWMLIDVDPCRAAGISATEAEKTLARDMIKAIKSWLTARGWPLPVLADSGNGYHADYHIELENTKENTLLIQRCLQALHMKFSNSLCKVDTSVFNPARIAKAYGSMACKGDNTATRPHRMARVYGLKDEPIVAVPVELLQALAAEVPEITVATRPDGKAVKYPAARMEAFAKHYGGKLVKKQRTAEDDGWMWIMKPCLLNSDHTGTSPAVILRDSGMMCWECKHDGCQMIWSEAVAELERMHPDKGKFYWETKTDWKTEFADANVEMDEVEVEAKAKPVKVAAVTVEREASGSQPLPTAEFIAEHVNTKTIADAPWDELADTLDALRERINYDDEGKAKKKFQHAGDEDILEFITAVFQKRAKLFVDAYPYIYLPSEDKLIKFHDDISAYQLLANLRLRMTQYDTDLVKKNLNLHIMTYGEDTHIEKWGCWRNENCYVNNGRGGFYKITEDAIEEVPNGTDGVYMLSPDLLPWPELDPVKIAAMQKKLGGYGLKITDGSKLCKHFNAMFDTSAEMLTSKQYQQLFLTRYLSIFLTGCMKLRPLMLALGEQNSGKSTLFEKVMWLLTGFDYESDGMPRDLRGLLAAITNNHLMIFDNIDNCDVEEEGYTDYLCKASTGGMVTIAELYKTNVDKKYNLRCDLFFTARVNPWPAHRSDLSRRTLFFPFRKPEQHEYKTVESMQEEMKADRDEMLIETLVRLQTIVKSLHSNMGVSYKPMSEMHSFETFTMRAANYEGWRQGMEDIWKGYFEEYETRITEYSPLVDEIRKWLGTSLKGGAYPNRGRKVTMGKLFEEIRRQVALDNGGYGGCTWKNESTFGRAVNKHYTSLRVLGVNKSTLNGYKCLTFDPKDDQWKMCIQAGKDLNLYHRAEDEQDLTGLDGIE